MCSNSGTVFTTGNSLRVAVNDYLSDKDAGLQLYGRMNCWDVSAITDMNSLFYWKSTMDEDIGCWDVSNVTNTEFMFYGASFFNHDLSKWDISKVVNMAYMFCGASLFNQSLCQWYPRISWNIVSSNSMLLNSGCDYISTPSVSYSATFCQVCHNFPSKAPSNRVTSFPSNKPSSTIVCPTGCSGNGKCRYPGVCDCFPGWGGIACSTPTCASNSFCNGNGHCIGYETCLCFDGFSGSSCSFVNCSYRNFCYGNGICSSPNVCSCYEGYEGVDCTNCRDNYRNISGVCTQCPNCLNGGTCNAQVMLKFFVNMFT